MSATNKEKNKGDTPVQFQNIYRLLPSQYQELEKKAISGLRFRDDTGPVQSGFLNGVEHVLRLIREGFTTQ